MERLLSARDIGKLLDVSPEVVRRLARDGKLRFVRLSARRIRIPETEVVAYLERQRPVDGVADRELPQ